jgi:hypothetical protein
MGRKNCFCPSKQKCRLQKYTQNFDIYIELEIRVKPTTKLIKMEIQNFNKEEPEKKCGWHTTDRKQNFEYVYIWPFPVYVFSYFFVRE